MAIKDEIEFHLSSDDAVKFAEWAVGLDFRNITQQDWPDRWNNRHKDLFQISGSGNPKQDLIKMIEIWKNKIQQDDLG